MNAASTPVVKARDLLPASRNYLILLFGSFGDGRSGGCELEVGSEVFRRGNSSGFVRRVSRTCLIDVVSENQCRLEKRVLLILSLRKKTRDSDKAQLGECCSADLSWRSLSFILDQAAFCIFSPGKKKKAKKKTAGVRRLSSGLRNGADG